MIRKTLFGRRALLVVAALALLAAACGDDSGGDSTTTTTGAAAGPTELSGLLAITPAECMGDTVESGSTFRMVEAGGTVEAGPYVANGDSTCGDQTFSSLVPGDDGGLLLGEYQEQPDPPFDEATSGAASAIVAPTPFFGLSFGVATNPTDPQTGDDAAAPTVTVAEDGSLTADLSAIGVAYGGQHFNQGSPKPDGSLPEGTTEPVGTYDADTGAYTLDWASFIQGGPFDGFTGIWHLEGTVETG